MDNFLCKLIEKEPLSNITYKLLGHYVTIFMLHRPENAKGTSHGHSLKLLDQCLSYATQKKFHFATPDEIASLAISDKTPEKPSICFTIDDGYADELHQLCPVFLKYGIRPTIFVLTDFIDNISWPWDAKLSYMLWHTTMDQVTCQLLGREFSLDFSTLERRTQSRREIISFAKTLKPENISLLIEQLAPQLGISLPATAPDGYQAATWDDLREYEKKGVNIGSHGQSHHVLNSLTNEQVAKELTHAQQRLAQELSSPSQVFCYPSGTRRDFSPHHTEMVRAAGYQAAVSANPGNTTISAIKASPFTILRHSFPSDFNTFVRYTSWIEALRTRFA